MAMTSRMLSTTQITSCLRIELAQMEQMSPSETLKQRWQNLISLRIRAMTSLNWPTSLLSCFNKCNTKRRAVFFPIPGSLANSLTAFSRREEENCIWQRYYWLLVFCYWLESFNFKIFELVRLFD